jgi:hypothetical protein
MSRASGGGAQSAVAFRVLSDCPAFIPRSARANGELRPQTACGRYTAGAHDAQQEFGVSEVAHSVAVKALACGKTETWTETRRARRNFQRHRSRVFLCVSQVCVPSSSPGQSLQVQRSLAPRRPPARHGDLQARPRRYSGAQSPGAPRQRLRLASEGKARTRGQRAIMPGTKRGQRGSQL